MDYTILLRRAFTLTVFKHSYNIELINIAYKINRNVLFVDTKGEKNAKKNMGRKVQPYYAYRLL